VPHCPLQKTSRNKSHINNALTHDCNIVKTANFIETQRTLTIIYIIILTETLDCPLPQGKFQGQRLALSNGTITVRSPHSTFHLRTWADPTSERSFFISDFEDFMCGI